MNFREGAVGGVGEWESEGPKLIDVPIVESGHSASLMYV